VNEELQENKKTKMEKCLSICSVNEELQENKKKQKWRTVCAYVQ
jgi:hypothetical protein